MSTQNEVLLNSKEAAALLRISPSALVGLRKTGGLPYVRLGKRILFKREALLDYINNSQVVDN